MQDTIGQRLKFIREELRLSQQELGDKIGISKQAISKIEKDSGFTTPEPLRKLIVDLNINLNYLIAGIGEPFIGQKKEVELTSDDIKILKEFALKHKR